MYYYFLTQGMEHNPGLSDEDDVKSYLQRDLTKKNKTNPPYKIIRDETVGRHLVAARNIQAGEIIFKEAPLTFGPLEITKPICLGCYTRVTLQSPSCDGCGFPMCSNECANSKTHKDLECAAFSQNGYKVNAATFNYEEEELTYSVISPIRTLMLKKLNPDSWNLAWMQMSHLAKRKEFDFWKQETEKVLSLLQTMIGPEESQPDLVEAILGIHLVNDFEINTADRSKEEEENVGLPSIRGLFALASMPNHDCLANTTHTFGSCQEGFVMTVKALRNIKSGEDITHSYAEPLNTVLARQTLLSMGKFFLCQCKRCSDPTELGTYASSVKCPGCKKGNVISTNTKELEAAWACEACKESLSAEKISLVTKAVKMAAEQLDLAPKIDDYEKFLSKYSSVLHTNHVLMVDKKYTLAKMYGRMKGYEADEMSDDQFQRKRRLCEEVLQVLDKIMPGRSRKRGMMKYELHLPLVMLSNRNLQRGPSCGVGPDTLKGDLQTGLQHLKEALDILGDEPEGSFESKIVAGSKESVTQLEDWVKTVSSAI